MSAVEDRLYRAIVTRFEGMGEAWTTDSSGDTLARAAAEEAVRELRLDDVELLPLPALVEARDRVGVARAELDAAASRARSAGHSWNEIGEALGTSRQAAYERFGRVTADA